MTCDSEEARNPAIRVIRKKVERSSWAALAEAIQGGDAHRVISVGDEIPVTLKNGETVVAVAVHENPYWENSMAFVIKDCLTDACQMNRSPKCGGGYAATDLRKHLIDDIVPILPDDMVSVIKPRTIVQKHNKRTAEFWILGNDTELSVSTDLIWIPSETEIVGSHESQNDVDFEDVHFDFFSDEKSRIKLRGNEMWFWWLRSPGARGTLFFSNVNSHGYSNYYYETNLYGVAFGFLI